MTEDTAYDECGTTTTGNPHVWVFDVVVVIVIVFGTVIVFGCDFVVIQNVSVMS